MFQLNFGFAVDLFLRRIHKNYKKQSFLKIFVDTFTDEKKLFWDKINIDFLTHLKHKIVYSSELWNLLTKCVQNIHKYIFNKV